ATITEPAELVATLANVVNNSCFGESKGAVNINVSGGTKPYNFAWSNDTTSQNLVNVPRGEYSVVVTDANGCFKTVSASVTEPPGMTVYRRILTDVYFYRATTCRMVVPVSCGAMPSTYGRNTGPKDQKRLLVLAMAYQLNVTDAKGCTNSVAAS